MKYYPAFVAKGLKKKVIAQIGKSVLAEKAAGLSGCCPDQVADLPAAGRLRPTS
jgi:hypothetical protein